MDWARATFGSGFGTGSGGGGLGSGGVLFGLKIGGDLGVVFDISVSMHRSIPTVTEQLKKHFAAAQVVAVNGARFHNDGDFELLPYKDNGGVRSSVLEKVRLFKQNMEITEKMNKELDSLEYCDSLSPYKGTNQSLGNAVLELIERGGVGSIYIFSDFQDGVDEQFMTEVATKCQEAGIVLFAHHPKTFRLDRANYEIMCTATGGEVKEGM